MRDIEGRQPVLAADRPTLVCRLQQIRRVEAADADLDIVAAPAEDGRPAGRTKMAGLVLRRHAGDRHGTFGKWQIPTR
jgi:hypothetical protein